MSLPTKIFTSESTLGSQRTVQTTTIVEGVILEELTETYDIPARRFSPELISRSRLVYQYNSQCRDRLERTILTEHALLPAATRGAPDPDEALDINYTFVMTKREIVSHEWEQVGFSFTYHLARKVTRTFTADEPLVADTSRVGNVGSHPYQQYSQAGAEVGYVPAVTTAPAGWYRYIYGRGHTEILEEQWEPLGDGVYSYKHTKTRRKTTLLKEAEDEEIAVPVGAYNRNIVETFHEVSDKPGPTSDCLSVTGIEDPEDEEDFDPEDPRPPGSGTIGEEGGEGSGDPANPTQPGHGSDGGSGEMAPPSEPGDPVAYNVIGAIHIRLMNAPLMLMPGDFLLLPNGQTVQVTGQVYQPTIGRLYQVSPALDEDLTEGAGVLMIRGLPRGGVSIGDNFLRVARPTLIIAGDQVTIGGETVTATRLHNDPGADIQRVVVHPPFAAAHAQTSLYRVTEFADRLRILPPEE